MNWRHEFVVDREGQLRYVQVLQVVDQSLIDEVERGTIVGEIIVGDQDSDGVIQYGVKVGAA